MKRMIPLLYAFVLFIFAIYSYTQIDLNLTLFIYPAYQKIQNYLIQVGYFNRPLSTSLYIILIILLFIFYFIFLKLVKMGKVSNREILFIILGTGLILILSYPAFSHDIFNYMFDARIFTKYGLNPYQYKALDFSGDLWTRFMHWTHRTYPYGPFWIILTIPLSFLGFQKFILTLVNFKIFFLATYYLNSYFIYLIYQKVDPRNALYATIFFALNPLILIEGLVSPHNDSVMLLFTFVAIYFLINKKYVVSLISIIISAGIKFVTWPLLPVLIYTAFFKKTNVSGQFNRIILILLLLCLSSTVFAVYTRELLPWYAVAPIGLASLIISNKLIKLISIVISLGLLFKYVSFIYLGEWTEKAYSNYLVIVCVLLISSVVIYFVKEKTNVLKFKV